GANRIGAGRLQDISRALSVPPAFFYEGAPVGDVHVGFAEAAGGTFVSDFVGTAEGLQLNRAFLKINDFRIRKRIIELVTTLAELKV
ncbi:MAG TPA: transcriptional regulator, partial [Beijerinckiaceae bacterium]